MSKSLGNGVDPIDAIENYGADALRFTLTNGIGPGNDLRLSEEKLRASRNFANKIWNAARFILMNGAKDALPDTLPDELRMEDKWIVSGVNRLIGEVTENIEQFETGVAATKLYEFIWDVFCDWYIEIAKLRLSGEDRAESGRCMQVLVWSMTSLLKLLHPYMPFITEEIYQALPHSNESIMTANYPVYSEALVFKSEETDFQMIMDAIKAVRVVRADMNVPTGKKINLFIEAKRNNVFDEGAEFITRLAGAREVVVGTGFDVPDAVRVVASGALILIPMEELVDKQKELIRLGKEKESSLRDIAVLESRLSNAEFIAKAPANIVEKETEKLTKAKEKLQLIVSSIDKLS